MRVEENLYLKKVWMLNRSHDLRLVQKGPARIVPRTVVQHFYCNGDLDVLSLGHPDALVDRPEGTVAQHVAPAQLGLLDRPQLGQVRPDRRLFAFVAGAFHSGHLRRHFDDVCLELCSVVVFVQVDDDDKE